MRHDINRFAFGFGLCLWTKEAKSSLLQDSGERLLVPKVVDATMDDALRFEVVVDGAIAHHAPWRGLALGGRAEPEG
jgi:hypothetical protein